MSEPDIFQRLHSAAAKLDLDFLLIGGHAVNAYGYERTTIDIDFLIAARNLTEWTKCLETLGYRVIHQVSAFAQFEPSVPGEMRIDLMLVDDATYGKLSAASRHIIYGNMDLQVVAPLHLIALKLHALRDPARSLDEKDFYDILSLIKTQNLDLQSPEFSGILNRYATDETRKRLFLSLGK